MNWEPVCLWQEAARAIRRTGCPALLHCDAVQGFLKVPFTPKQLGVDLLSISGHKVHAPKGIGALYIRKGLKLPPLMLGGGQENGLRPGTEPTAQIAAFAAACQEGKASFAADTAHMAQLPGLCVQSLDGCSAGADGARSRGCSPHSAGLSARI